MWVINNFIWHLWSNLYPFNCTNPLSMLKSKVYYIILDLFDFFLLFLYFGVYTIWQVQLEMDSESNVLKPRNMKILLLKISGEVSSWNEIMYVLFLFFSLSLLFYLVGERGCGSLVGHGSFNYLMPPHVFMVFRKEKLFR